jgi:hypothetical protein
MEVVTAPPPAPPQRDEFEALIEEARRRARRRRLFGLCALLAVLVAGAIWVGLARDGEAAAGRAVPPGGPVSATNVSLEITVSTPDRDGNRIEKRFTLRCDPPAGTLPLAERVCRDIRRHPQAMLAPAPHRWVCLGRLHPTVVAVRGTAGGGRLAFDGVPNCYWPGGTPLAIYHAAAFGNAVGLDRAEPRLRCEDDPVLLGHPTPAASAVACVRGLWTPRAARLIRLAKSVPALAALPARLFPANVGVLPCRIPVGGPVRRTLAGKCGVSIKNNWSMPTVSFVESWPGRGKPRHIWRVTIRGANATLTEETGPPPPQRWR